MEHNGLGMRRWQVLLAEMANIRYNGYNVGGRPRNSTVDVTWSSFVAVKFSTTLNPQSLATNKMRTWRKIDGRAVVQQSPSNLCFMYPKKYLQINESKGNSMAIAEDKDNVIEWASRFKIIYLNFIIVEIYEKNRSTGLAIISRKLAYVRRGHINEAHKLFLSFEIVPSQHLCRKSVQFPQWTGWIRVWIMFWKSCLHDSIHIRFNLIML